MDISKMIGEKDNGDYGLLIDRCRLEEVWESLYKDFVCYEIQPWHNAFVFGYLVAALDKRRNLYLGSVGVSHSDPEIAIVFRLTLEGNIDSWMSNSERIKRDHTPLVKRLREKGMSNEEKPSVNSHDVAYDLGQLTFWSFRYALGRKSAAVSIVADFVIKYKDFLDENDRERIIKEITEAINSDRAGDDCDKEEWFRVREILSVRKRGS